MPLQREVVPDVLGGERVDKVVAMLTGLARGEVAALVEAGAVTVGGRVIASRSRKLSVGDVLEVEVPEADPTGGLPQPDGSIDVPVVHADEHVVVVDKPAGLVVHPGHGTPDKTLVNGLLARFPDIAEVGAPDRPGIVHRLDAGTSGLLVVARTPEAYDDLVAQLSARLVERRYWALVAGAVAAKAGLIDAPLGRDKREPIKQAVVKDGKEARTRYEVLDLLDGPGGPRTWIECRLETGRTHQIRVHLAAIGHPVVADGLYGGPPLEGVTRPFLHAHRLAFDHPGSGDRIGFDSALPADLAAARAAIA